MSQDTPNTPSETPNEQAQDEQPDFSKMTLEEKKARVMEALRAVVDPEIGLNVVQLGLIRELDIQDDRMHIVMILTTPFCPYGPQIIQQTRMTIDTVVGGGSVVEMGTELWDPSMMEEGAGGDWGLF